MNRIGQIARLVTLAALAVLSAAPAHAQMQRYDPAIPRGVPEQRIEPSGELVQPAPAPVPPRLIQNERRTQRDSDARHCLTLATNRSVHRCAERYRSGAARVAAVKKASSKPSSAAAPIAMETSRTPDAVKPGGPSPGDVAKAAELVKPMDVTKPGGTPRTIDSTAKAAEPARPAAQAPGTTPASPAVKPAAPVSPASPATTTKSGDAAKASK